MKTKQQIIDVLTNEYAGMALDWEAFEKRTGLKISKYYWGEAAIDPSMPTLVAYLNNTENNFRYLKGFTKAQLEVMLELLKADKESGNQYSPYQ